MELDDLIRRGDAMLAAVDLGDERIADAIRAIPARGVKPLVWTNDGAGVWRAVDRLGAYYEINQSDARFQLNLVARLDAAHVGQYASLDAAKAAAQADYEARILAALPPAAQPGADVAAQAREAALDAIKMGFLSAAPGEWRVGDIERVTTAILRALEEEGRDG